MTDRWTDGHHVPAIAALMHSIARQKWFSPKKIKFLLHFFEETNTYSAKRFLKEFPAKQWSLN